MSKDLVRLLKLQEVGTSAPPSRPGGIDESFRKIRQELDALASTVSNVSEHRDELERKEALQALELRALRTAVEEREATRQKLEQQVTSLKAQLYCGPDFPEEGNTVNEQGDARDEPIESLDPVAHEFYAWPETGVPKKLNIEAVPTKWKQEGAGWFAVFNPNVERVLDISLVKTFKHEGPVHCVRLSPDMKYLAAACGPTVQIYDAKTGSKMWIFPTNKPAKSICFSPDSSMLAVGTSGDQLNIWEIATQEVRYTFSGNKAGVISLCFSPDGKVLVSGSYNNIARIWSLQDGTCKTIWEESGSVLSIAILPNGLLALGRRNGSVGVWSTKERNPVLIETILAHDNAARSLAFTRRTGNGLLSASEDKSLKYWDVSPLLGTRKALEERRKAVGDESVIQCKLRLTGHKLSVSSLAVSHDDRWVVSGSYDQCVHFWDLETATLHSILKGHTDFVTSVDHSQTGNILVTGGKDGQVRMWRYA